MTHDSHATVGRTDPTLTVITLLLVAYAAAAAAGWPQYGRDLLVAAQAAHGHADAHAEHDDAQALLREAVPLADDAERRWGHAAGPLVAMLRDFL